MIDGKNFFNQPVKNDKLTYESIRKIATGQGDDCVTGCIVGLYLVQKILQNDCYIFKQRTSSRCQS